MDLIASGESPSEVSDIIKDMIYVKAAEKIEKIRPEVYNSSLNSEE